MAYKRQIDRLPIPPKDAKVHNVTCHYCIVGCGYKAYTWDRNKQGTTTENAFGIDLGTQQGADGTWIAPSMYNIVRQNGKDVHLAVVPDENCVVNSGLTSVRGARMAENRPSEVTGTQQQRLTDPLVWKNGSWQPTSWDDALSLVGEVTARVVAKSESDLFVSMFDHGGSAGGYENTWGTGKLYFDSMKIGNCRIHNRPAYNSEVHSSRDMGVAELSYKYSDYQTTDCIVMVGTNPLECQTNVFLNHMVPGMRNGAKYISVDPRRTVSHNAAEEVAGMENTLHLAIKTGTDMVLFNAIMTLMVDNGWTDNDFIENSTFRDGIAVADDGAGQPASLGSLEMAMESIRTSLDEAADICGVPAADIAKAAAWMAEPKSDGARRTCVIGYEKGVIWGNDNYRTIGAIVNVALASGNIGRVSGGCVRMGGHQEGYFRPPEPVTRPAPYLDQMIINGEGKVHHIWANDHYKTTLNAGKYKLAHQKRADKVKYAMDAAASGSREDLVNAIVDAVNDGGLFVVNVDIIHGKIGQNAHVILPAAESNEMNLTSMNGERRLRLSEKYMDPPGSAKPDCLIAAGMAQAMEKALRKMGMDAYADQFKGYDWQTEEDAFMDGFNSAHPDVTYDTLRAMGNDGVLEPVIGIENGRLIGTDRPYADGKFDRHGREDKKALFCASGWRGWEAPGKAEEQAAYPFYINNGRANVYWQNQFLDQANDFVQDRYRGYPFIEMHPDDMASIGAGAGDIVKISNANGAAEAMVYPTPTARRGETFMLFGSPASSVGNVINGGTNTLMLPDYKHAWANIEKISDMPASVKGISFKSKEYTA